MVLPIFLAPFVTAITGSIGWIARSVLPFLIGHVFSSLLFRIGLFLVWLLAVTAGVNTMLDMAQGYLSGLPGDLLDLMQLTGMINALNIIASAYLFKLTLKIDSVKLVTSTS